MNDGEHTQSERGPQQLRRNTARIIAEERPVYLACGRPFGADQYGFILWAAFGLYTSADTQAHETYTFRLRSPCDILRGHWDYFGPTRSN